MSANPCPPLTREQVISVIEGRADTPRVPLQIHLWVHPPAFGDRQEAVEAILARYPEDVQIVPLAMPALHDAPADAPGYRWLPYDDPYAGQEVALDERVSLPDWGPLDEVLAHWPSPDYAGLFQWAPPADGRYRLAHWWFGLFERHWSLRGMTNALTDYYLFPDQVHRLFQAITDFYMAAMTRAHEEQSVDGIFTSDDLGTQKAPFFSPTIFRRFFKPYYQQLVAHAHRLGTHFWLHVCGNVEPFVPHWVEMGLDVLHPIQKYTMDEADIAARFGSQLTIFTGLDVQQILPWGTPEDVRREVRFLLDTYWRPGEGRCLLTAGNGINEDCPLGNLEAFYDEAVRYGAKLATR
jgi:hypothetical protein